MAIDRHAAFLLVLLCINFRLPAQTKSTTGGWYSNNKRDAIDGTMHRGVETNVPAEEDDNRVGYANVRATCDSIPSLSLEVTFQTTKGRNPGFETSHFGLSDLSLLTLKLAENLTLTRSRVRIDDYVTTARSRVHYNNALSIVFFDRWSESDLMGAPFGRGLYPPAASLARAFTAKQIIVELPLANGQRPVVRLNLQDPTYRAFIAACDGYAAATAPPPPAPPPDYLENARKHMASHEFGAALGDYNTVLKQDPGNAEAKQGIDAIEKVVPERQLAFVTGLERKGIWLDGNTNLMWTMKDSDKEFYNDGSVYCYNLRAGALSGWRLPSIAELQTIYDPKAPNHNKAGIELRGSQAAVSASSGNQDCDYFSFQNGSYRQFFNFQCSQVYVRAICVRPYQMDIDGIGDPREPLAAVADGSSPQPPKPAAPRANTPFEDPVMKAFKESHDRGDVPTPPKPSSDPATYYYEQGKYLLGQSLVDQRTGKVQPAPGSVEALKKYLAVAPNGEHAEEVRGLLRSLGIK